MKSLIKPLAVGSFTAPNNVWLAPMAGITDGPFRALCLRGGAGVVCAEMVSAHALHYENPRSLRMLSISEREKPVSMQIFGSDEQTIAEAARAAEARGADIIDINAGCPVKKNQSCRGRVRADERSRSLGPFGSGGGKSGQSACYLKNTNFFKTR